MDDRQRRIDLYSQFKKNLRKVTVGSLLTRQMEEFKKQELATMREDLELSLEEAPD